MTPPHFRFYHSCLLSTDHDLQLSTEVRVHTSEVCLSSWHLGWGSADVSPSQSVQVGIQQSQVIRGRVWTSDQHGPILSLPMTLFRV